MIESGSECQIGVCVLHPFTAGLFVCFLVLEGVLEAVVVVVVEVLKSEKIP